MSDDSHANPPIRYCTRCRAEITAERVARGSFFCGNDCRAADKNGRRAWKASRNCRLCGRAARRPKKAGVASQTQAAVAEASRVCATGAQGDVALVGESIKQGERVHAQG